MSTVIPADLDFSTPIFPVNVINILEGRFSYFTNLNILRRPLRHTDRNLSLGISARTWNPVAGSQEMRGPHAGSQVSDPYANSSTLEQYVILVEALVKHTSEDVGLAMHSVVSEAVRTTLDDDAPLRVLLGGLEANFGTTTKRLKRFWVRSSTYASGTLQGAFVYVTTCDYVIEVEKI